MDASHVYDAPPEGVNADWTMPQSWAQFTERDHARWSQFAAKQTKALEGLACDTFLEGVRALELDRMGVPEYDVWNERLRDLTGWEVVAVPGVIPNEPFFKMLAERKFPVANFLRQGPSFEYNDEPDMFHDVYGHMPMFIDPTFGEFMTAYGRAGLRAEKLGMSDWVVQHHITDLRDILWQTKYVRRSILVKPSTVNCRRKRWLHPATHSLGFASE